MQGALCNESAGLTEILDFCKGLKIKSLNIKQFTPLWTCLVTK
uniref:Uncharacterized protein n=1 Tax=Anguilla anguilla TaxID=7936 RepID=A0A0E9S4W9_ANGAN